MITLTLKFPEESLPRLHGEDAARFVLNILKENPQFAIRAATEVEVKGPTVGRIVEQR